ncbi:hypothetical protein PRZ48_004785 [Zasmidium cellare]|uniref:Uncharacterized protein n=1 Tax=Zasmidium cellare TaxID=395010 RepID=A0ABR0EQU3_ZASCE|nr:hypothetical protein PRZ48_004785 [Zasmidium cellare]
MSDTQPPPEPDQCSRTPVDMEVLKYNSTAHYLEDLTRKMIAELLTHDFRNSSLLNKHEHEDFIFASTGDGNDCPLPYFQGRQNHFDAMDHLFKQDPTYKMELHNPVALVHRGTRKAEVYSVVALDNVDFGLDNSKDFQSDYHVDRTASVTPANPHEHLEVLGYKSTKRYLEDLGRRMMIAYFSPDLKDSLLLQRHEHDDFIYSDAGGIPSERPLPYFRGRQEHHELLQKFLQQNPTYKKEILNVTAKVHRGTRKAEVYHTAIEKWQTDGHLELESIWQMVIEPHDNRLYYFLQLHGVQLDQCPLHTVTQNYTITSGQSTSFIPVQATETITSYDYICSGDIPTATAQPQKVRRQNGPQESCVAYLARYRNNNGINAACSCVVESLPSATVITETEIVPTGTTVTITSTRVGRGVLTSGVTTSTSISLATITTTSIESRNATVPNVVPVTTTTGTSYITTRIPTATPIPTSFRLTVTLDDQNLTARAVDVNAGRALAFSPDNGGNTFAINADSDLVNNNLFLTVLTEVEPNVIPFLFWENPSQVPSNSSILNVDACEGVLRAAGEDVGEDVWALCEFDELLLLALGTRELFEGNPETCSVVEVGLDPGFVDVPSNSTVTPRGLLGKRYPLVK